MPICPKCHDAHLIQASDPSKLVCLGCNAVFKLTERGKQR